jgi:hypothetical protein
VVRHFLEQCGGSNQGSLTEGEGSVQLTSLYYCLDKLLFTMKILFTLLQNKQPE